MTGLRIKELRELKNLTQRDFAEIISVQPGTVGMWESGKRVPKRSTLQKIADYFNVTIDYLLGDSKYPYHQSRPDSNVKQLDLPRMVEIPVYGRVPAGIPLEAVEDIRGTIAFPESKLSHGEYAAFEVMGNSMYPKYFPGDVVIVRMQEDCESGQDAIVYVNGYEATLKTVKKVGNRIELWPFNLQQYQMQSYGPDDDPVKILGVVEEMRRKA